MAMTEKKKKELKEKQIMSGNTYGIKNLKPVNTLPIERQKEIRQKAAAATNEIKARKKDIKYICNELLGINALDIAKDILDKDIVKKMQDNDVNVTLYDLIVIKQIQQAIENKDTKAATFLRDSAGDKPSDRMEQDINIMTESDMALLNSINDRLESLESIDTTYKSE